MLDSRLWILFLLATLLGAVTTVQAAPKYSLSMLPRYSPEEIMQRITPLSKYLSQRLQVTIAPVVASNFKEYETRLRGGSIQIGYENPYIYTLVSPEHEVVGMALKGWEGNRFRGIIITRSDSSIRTISDLKGATVAIVSKTSAGGYLSQRISLQERGLDPDRDIQIIEALDNKQENVIFSVYLGDADAGFIRESALDSASAYVPPHQIRIMAHTAWLPNWALSVSRTLPQKLKRAITQAILDLRGNNEALKALKIQRFIRASDANYDIMRKAAGLPIPTR